MPAALVVPVSGPYVGLWDSVPLGTQNDDGFVLQGTFQGQEVNSSDAYGMTLVEAIHRGINWRMRFRGLEFNKRGILSAIQAFGTLGADPETTFKPSLGFIGHRYSANARTLLLNSLVASPPSFVTTLTAQLAIVAPQSNVEYLFTSKVREAPFEMVLLPYTVATFDAAAFTTT